MKKTLAWLMAVIPLAVACSTAEETTESPQPQGSDDVAPTPTEPDEGENVAASALTTDELRIMTYNIKYGAESGLDLQKIADVINPSHPDILGLQEVDDGTNRSGKKKETDELSALTGMQYRYFGANFDYDGGKYGLAILSKYPLVDPRVIRLDELQTSPQPGHESRIAVAADVDVRGKAVTFVTLHASLHEDEHKLNATRILQALGDKKTQAIVVGDMNETPGSDLGNSLTSAGFIDTFNEKHRFSLGWTQPANFPMRRIDFIYRARSFGKTSHAWVPDSKASDHRPVAVTIPTQ